MSFDPAELCRALIACPSVTPADAGAQATLIAALERLGFRIHRLRFGAIENFYARIGESGPHLCFAGHTDVVPVGQGWTHDPFAPHTQDGRIYGRGACDMKGAIAAFVAAAAGIVQAGPLPGSLSLLITGDEEGEARDGTVRVLEWMAERQEIPDFCLVGEPTNPGALGEVIKIGRRGSLNAAITVLGVQGHAAYPQRADNPVHPLVAALAELIATPLDQGSAHFEASSLQITSVDVGNPATNVIPATATARLNVRFNDLHSGESIAAHVRGVVARHCKRAEVAIAISGESFLTEPGPEIELLQSAISRVCGGPARLDTGGGTSDARFIARYTRVAEFGLVGASMHKADEHVALGDLAALTAIYADFIGGFFGRAGGDSAAQGGGR